MQPIDSINRTACTRRARRSEKASTSRRKLARPSGARHASDGEALFLGLLALARPQPPNLLLIEEPENGIYPKRLGEVIELLKQMVHRTEGVPFPQIILSTHSPYVLSFFEPEEVTFLSRAPGPADTPVRVGLCATPRISANV